MPALSQTEMAEFLAEPGHLLRLASVDEDGMPRVVPTWFLFNDGEILFTPRGTSAVLGNLRRDPRVGLSVDEEPLPYRKVTVQGRARVIHDLGEDDRWRDRYRSIARRYISAQAADAYVDDTIDQPRALLSVPLAGSRVSTWRMPVADEDPSSIWASRYYVEGTRMTPLERRRT